MKQPSTEVICPKHGKLWGKPEVAKWYHDGRSGSLCGKFCAMCMAYYTNSALPLINYPTWKGYPLRSTQDSAREEEKGSSVKKKLPSYVKVIAPEEQEKYRIENEKHRAEWNKKQEEKREEKKEENEEPLEERLNKLKKSGVVWRFPLLYEYIKILIMEDGNADWKSKQINRLRLELSIEIRDAGYYAPKKFATRMDTIISRYMDPSNAQKQCGSIQAFDDAIWELLDKPDEKQQKKAELRTDRKKFQDDAKRKADFLDTSLLEIRHDSKIYREEIDLTRNQVDIFVNRGSLRCQREKHTIINVRAIVWAKTNAVKIPIQKCITCHPHFYFIGQQELNELEQQYGVLMLQYADGPGKSGQMEDAGFAVESVIHKMGYTVSEQQGLTMLARQRILVDAIVGGRVSKAGVMSHLEKQIQLRKNDSRMSRAIEKWREDLDFLAHRLDSDEYYIGKLTRKKR